MEMDVNSSWNIPQRVLFQIMRISVKVLQQFANLLEKINCRKMPMRLLGSVKRDIHWRAGCLTHRGVSSRARCVRRNWWRHILW